MSLARYQLSPFLNPVSNVPVSSQLLPTSSDLASTRPPPVNSDPVEIQQLPLSTTGNLCLLFGVGCPPSSIPVGSDPIPTRSPVGSESPEPTQPSVSANLPPFTTSPSTSQPPSLGPPSTIGVSIPFGSSTSILRYLCLFRDDFSVLTFGQYYLPLREFRSPPVIDFQLPVNKLRDRLRPILNLSG